MINNFLEDTEEAIRNSGHRVKDIVFIGSEKTGHQCSWRTFRKIANKSYYSVDVADDLMIVFRDRQYMYRHSDGFIESWEYLVPFKHPETRHRIRRVIWKHPVVALNNTRALEELNLDMGNEGEKE